MLSAYPWCFQAPLQQWIKLALFDRHSLSYLTSTTSSTSCQSQCWTFEYRWPCTGKKKWLHLYNQTQASAEKQILLFNTHDIAWPLTLHCVWAHTHVYTNTRTHTSTHYTLASWGKERERKTSLKKPYLSNFRDHHPEASDLHSGEFGNVSLGVTL